MYAITLGRNVLLKTISQPRCEGVRFHLCLKKGTDGPDILSLVSTGVDASGKDLLYDYDANLEVQDIPTRSLVAEYGYPSHRLQATSPATDPFVLFKFAQIANGLQCRTNINGHTRLHNFFGGKRRVQIKLAGLVGDLVSRKFKSGRDNLRRPATRRCFTGNGHQ